VTQKPLYQPWNDEVFRGDVLVQSMNHLQRWMYMSLLHQAFFYSTRPYLPDDDEILWRLAGCPNRMMWEENSSDVKAMFVKTEIDGVKLLEHKRVVEDYERVMNKRQEMHDRAVRGGRASAQARGQAQVEPKLNTSSTPVEPNPTKRSEVKLSEVLQDQRRARQSDFHPTQYAANLMEAIGMPHTQANLRVVASAITAEAKTKGGESPMSAAFDSLLDKAKAATDEGVVIDKFWFEDRKWMRGQAPAKGPCTKHPQSGLTVNGTCYACYEEVTV
jgi:uncharacterized protein YdaU (DUF1376 family)